MTTIASEIDRFDRLSATWWNGTGPMRPLHVINELQLTYVLERVLAQCAGAGRSTLEGLRYLPVMHHVSWIRDTSVNYIATFAHANAARGLLRRSPWSPSTPPRGPLQR
jgi:2-polyprenyl-6-hydroxyphenyl methylase/3-demethylubiquinone-9 3-methyltransferase